MGVALGWKRVAPQFPYVEGQVWNDGITRSGNKVNFIFNFNFRVPTATGYWNYAWYVNVKCGNVQVTDKKIKDQTYKNEKIGGKEYWYGNINGFFTGSIDVSGQATTIPVTLTFHDSAGNWGEPQTWNVSIPAASSMGGVRGSASVSGPESATISASVSSTGAYSTITRWELLYGKGNYSNSQVSTQNLTSMSWRLSDLDPATYYTYRINVQNSSGYSSSYDGTFFTEDSQIGNLVVEGEPAHILSGWIIRPDGQTQRIKEIRKVVG